jgi:hypothetical protein
MDMRDALLAKIQWMRESMKKPIPPAPPSWNKTIRDLLAEVDRGESGSVGSPEVDWARDYERSMLPADIRYPRKGDIYEAVTDFEVTYLTAWTAPYTGDGRGSLKGGDRLCIEHEPSNPKPTSVYATAVNYEDLEKRLVPPDVRKNEQYSGYYFSIKTADLHSLFKLVHADTEK